MANEQNPMPLENLPEYLKSVKENGNENDSCVVDIGQVKNSKPKKWSQIIILSSVFMIAGTVGMITYDLNKTKQQQFTVVVDLNKGVNPLKSLEEMINDDDKIIAVKQKEGSVYEVKIFTRKSRKVLLEWLNKNKNVKEVN